MKKNFKKAVQIYFYIGLPRFYSDMLTQRTTSNSRHCTEILREKTGTPAVILTGGLHVGAVPEGRSLSADWLWVSAALEGPGSSPSPSPPSLADNRPPTVQAQSGFVRPGPTPSADVQHRPHPCRPLAALMSLADGGEPEHSGSVEAAPVAATHKEAVSEVVQVSLGLLHTGVVLYNTSTRLSSAATGIVGEGISSRPVRRGPPRPQAFSLYHLVTLESFHPAVGVTTPLLKQLNVPAGRHQGVQGPGSRPG